MWSDLRDTAIRFVILVIMLKLLGAKWFNLQAIIAKRLHQFQYPFLFFHRGFLWSAHAASFVAASAAYVMQLTTASRIKQEDEAIINGIGQKGCNILVFLLHYNNTCASSQGHAVFSVHFADACANFAMSIIPNC